MHTNFRTYLAGAALAVTALVPVLSQPAMALEDGDKAKIESIIHDYLLENPEILLEVQDALQNKQAAHEQEQQKKVISDSRDEIFHNASDPVLGNPDGDVTVVEFFDYNCGFCKRAMSDMTSMLEADDNLRFVLKEFPILGPESQEAHKVALAFQRLHPEKYAQFHLRLLGFQGRANEESAMKIAKELGADEDKMRKEMSDASLGDPVKSTYELANKLGISGTPSYVVGNEVISGALGEDVLTTKVANMRECGKTMC